MLWILRRVARVQLRQRHLASDLSSLDSWIALSARRLVLTVLALAFLAIIGGPLHFITVHLPHAALALIANA